MAGGRHVAEQGEGAGRAVVALRSSACSFSALSAARVPLGCKTHGISLAIDLPGSPTATALLTVVKRIPVFCVQVCAETASQSRSGCCAHAPATARAARTRCVNHVGAAAEMRGHGPRAASARVYECRAHPEVCSEVRRRLPPRRQVLLRCFTDPAKVAVTVSTQRRGRMYSRAALARARSAWSQWTQRSHRRATGSCASSRASCLSRPTARICATISASDTKSGCVSGTPFLYSSQSSAADFS